MDEEKLLKDVLNIVQSKSVLKRDVYELTKERFNNLKIELSQLTEVLQKETELFDSRLEVSYKELGSYFCQLTIAGDTLLFAMHTNVFKFEENSSYWQSSYLQEDINRGFCGSIQVYNFLADSLRFNRQNDVGYMVARIFLNHENHFFVEGKQRLGYLFNDFINSEFNPSCIRKVILSIIQYTLNFDLFTPKYETVQEVTLQEVSKEKDRISLRTGKRLGFQMSSGESDFRD